MNNNEEKKIVPLTESLKQVSVGMVCVGDSMDGIQDGNFSFGGLSSGGEQSGGSQGEQSCTEEVFNS